MRTSMWSTAALLLLGTAAWGATAAPTPPPASPDELTMPQFGVVHLARPAAVPLKPSRVVLLISDAAGPGSTEQALVQALTGEGALVASVDLREYARRVANAKNRCAYAAAHFEALSQGLQKQLGLRTYVSPILVGVGEGGTLAYAVLAESPPATFAGAVSLGYCPELRLGAPLCKQNHLEHTPSANGAMAIAPATALPGAWVTVPGTTAACAAPTWELALPSVARLAPAAPTPAALAAALGRLDALVEPPPPPPSDAQVADLPLIEMPTAAKSRDLLAVIYSGDGGWAGLDREVGGALLAAGVPVVGVSSLQYFWTRRTPDGAAADLERMLRHYLDAWQRRRVLLVGYSAGADVLPFLAARLPRDLRARVAAVALLGPSPTANFEFHVSEWLGHEDDTALPVAPEVAKLAGVQVLCFYGQDESDSLCPALPKDSVKLFPEAGSHHFGGHYDVLAAAILQEIGTVTP